MSDLTGKVVIVTGAARGIGRAIASHLYDVGASVLAVSRDTGALEGLAAEIGDPKRFAVSRVDVAREDEVAAAVDQAVSTWGRLTGIVNNAAVLIPNTAAAASADEFDVTFNVNVRGLFFGCKYAIPALLEAGGGSIVNIGSINSLAAEKELALYCASKGAVLTLTQSIALDFGGRGIRANAVCPGFVDTELNVPHYNRLGGAEALWAALPDWQPIGRAIEPVEIAKSVAFLLSDDAAAITGTSFVVDGGVLCKA